MTITQDTLIALLGLIIPVIAILGIDKVITLRVDHKVDKKYQELDEQRKLLVNTIILKSDLSSLQSEIKFLYQDNDKQIVSNELSQLSLEVVEKVPKLKDLFIKAKELQVINETKNLIQSLFNLAIALLFFLRKYEEINTLQEYGSFFDLKPETWANFSITNMVLYMENRQFVFKDNAIEASKKATKISPNYGTPVAVRLIITMIDYKTTQEEQYKKQAEELIRSINSAKLPEVASGVLAYLERNRPFKDTWDYIDLLYQSFPNQMSGMKNRANSISAGNTTLNQQIAENTEKSMFQ